ncbi:MAG: molybdopterin cofactor-binding domain-containing protein, partial [Woeseiaceae bacterium]
MRNIHKITRRDFLKRTGQAGGMVIGFSLTSGCGPMGSAPVASGRNVMPNVYVNVRDDDIVEIHCHRSEMGQGIRTGLPQVIADELEADWDKIELVQTIGDEKYGDQNTDGSTSIRKHFDLLRGAGASAREMLVAAAASAWGTSADECVAREHAVHHEASGRRMTFGELVAHTDGIEVPENPSFKDKADYRYISAPIDIIDGVAMTTGTANYGIDTVLPGMLYASVEHCPAHGGTVKSLDDTAARAVPGVVDVIRMPNPTAPVFFNPLGGVAVVATNTWAANKGREVLEVEWDYGANAAYDSEKFREELMVSCCNEGDTVLNRGDAHAAIADAANTHSAEYYAPHLAHSTMEPPAAAACMTEDGNCEVWACTQHPQGLQDTIAGLLGIDKKQVIVHVTLLGGGFGRKSKGDFAAEAAYLARETGKPVKVTWTREDDIRHGFYHAVSAQHLEAGLDNDGNVTSWLHRTVFPTIMSTFAPGATDPMPLELSLGFVDNPYDVPNMRLETGRAQAHLRIGWFRSVCNVYHAFATCSFADELAHRAGEDPKDFLLRLIGPPRRINPADDGAEYTNYENSLETHPIDTGRIANVVNTVADMAGWGRELPEGRGLGIAVHRSFVSTIGTVA